MMMNTAKRNERSRDSHLIKRPPISTNTTYLAKPADNTESSVVPGTYRNMFACGINFPETTIGMTTVLY